MDVPASCLSRASGSKIDINVDDANFKQIYRDKRYNVMPKHDAPKLIELWGSREERLERLDQALAACTH